MHSLGEWSSGDATAFSNDTLEITPDSTGFNRAKVTNQVGPSVLGTKVGGMAEKWGACELPLADRGCGSVSEKGVIRANGLKFAKGQH